MRSWSPGALLALAAALLLGVVVLSVRAVLAPVGPTATPSPPAIRTPTVAFPSAEPSFDLSKPLTVVEVGQGHPVSIDGRGPRQIAYRVVDGSAVKLHLDCSLCDSGATVIADDRRLLASTTAASVEEVLNDLPSDPETLLIVDTIGRWRLTLVPVG